MDQLSVQKSSFQTKLSTQIDKSFTSTNYIAVYGEDMKNTVHTLPSGIKAVIYNEELFIMDGRVSHDDVVYVMDTLLDKVKCVIVFCYERSAVDYIVDEGNLAELITLVKADIRSADIEVYTLNSVRDFGIPETVKPMSPSDYIGRTCNFNSIFNMTITVCGEPYIITVVLNGFVAKNISMPILETARDHIKAVFGAKYFFLDKEGYVDTDKNLAQKLYNIITGKNKEDDNYDSLRYVINSNGSFLDDLRNNEEFGEAFGELKNKNILINIRAIRKNDLP